METLTVFFLFYLMLFAESLPVTRYEDHHSETISHFDGDNFDHSRQIESSIGRNYYREFVNYKNQHGSISRFQGEREDGYEILDRGDRKENELSTTFRRGDKLQQQSDDHHHNDEWFNPEAELIDSNKASQELKNVRFMRLINNKDI